MIFAQAQEAEVFVKEVSMASDDRLMAQQQALREVSKDLMEEMLGVDKFQKYKAKITKQIIKKPKPLYSLCALLPT